MSALRDLLQELSARDVKLRAEGGQLRIRAPKGSVDEDLRGRLLAHKADLIAFLEPAPDEALPRVAADPAHRHEPFPLTDLQQAYWIGSSADIERSGGYHYYLEFDVASLDVAQLGRAWQMLIDRHEMLRAIILPDGLQQILPDVPPYDMAVHDLRQLPDDSEALAAIREELSHRACPLDRWPLCEVQVSLRRNGPARVHVSLGLVTLDSGSMMILFDEWQRLYRDPAAPLAPLPVSFRDYVFAEREMETTAQYRKAERYWLDRLADLPPAPELPFARIDHDPAEGHFERLTGTLDAARWTALKQRAVSFGITPSALLLTAFSEILATWSASPRFTLNVTLFNRLPLADGINSIVGDFTSVALLAVDFSRRRPFAEHAAEVNRRLQDDLDHRAYSGVRVLREWARAQGSTGRPLAPVVFSSTLVLGTRPDFSLHGLFGGELHYAISQTPQCHLDHQLMEDEGRLVFHWDVVRGLYPDGMVADMFSAYTQLLARLAGADAAMTEIRRPWIPDAQRRRHAEINRTEAGIPDQTLIALFTEQVAKHRDAPALIAPDRTISYAELDLRARRVAAWLREAGTGREELVAIAMHKGWEQVVGVLGALMAGAAYLPIDPDLPAQRRAHLLREGRVRAVLTQSALRPDDTGLRVLAVDAQPQDFMPPEAASSSPGDLAYVLYTSGSTGLPKGVMIEQRSVVNRMTEVAQRFGLGPGDRVLGLTALHHDLSVFDIFGMLCCIGGAVVLPDAGQIREPAHWAALLIRERVTLWNSVPAFLGMLVEHLEAAPALRLRDLRWCILAGDFIPVPLPDRIRACAPGLQVVASGGPTETTVWDICNPLGDVDLRLPSIPYGKPMANARYYVLKDNLDPCPDWTPGELCIGGAGLARGYWNDEAATAAKFFAHPETGERLYRSGDIGRYLPDGNIEIMARRDFQVKIQGQRIELGEIEAALVKLPQVRQAVVTVESPTPESRRLAAHLVLAQDDEAAVSEGAALRASSAAQMEFKLRQPGVIAPQPGTALVALPPVGDTDAEPFLARQSHRRFTGAPVSAEQFSALLAGLRQHPLDGAPLPKYRYPSGGSLYPVQTYLHVKPGGVAGVAPGFYYYQPQRHALMPVGTDDTSRLYGGPNRFLFDACGFALFLVGNLDAVEPLYPGAGREFCLIEAGHIGQILMERAGGQNIGLCPIGMGIAEAPLREACGLGERHILVYGLVGGAIAAEWNTRWMAYAAQAQPWHEPIRQALQDILPAHMIPTTYRRWAALPLTANGKVDRRRLAQETAAPPVDTSRPANETEARLAALLAELLGLPQVAIHTQFFDLGATSVTLVKFRNRVQQAWNRTLSMVDLFGCGDIHHLAELLGGASQGAEDTALRDMVARAGRQKRALARHR